MRQRGGCGRLAWAAFAVCCSLATLHAQPYESHGAWSRFVLGTAATPFRLGTAGRPFAASTAIGDLNGDGTLDYAVADRVGRDLAGFAYSVDLSISGIANQRVWFSSPESAVSISVRDIDHDHDLDVVVSTVVSPQVIRVWLNDGFGAFAETNTIDTTEWQATASLAPDADGSTLKGIETKSRRARDSLTLSREGAPRSLVRWSSPASSDPRPLWRDVDARQPRAPPVVASPIL